jgi:MinD-like ATPase involved in chromosome partitioning or flagellar assembly
VTIVAVTGDASTTTSVTLAAGWPAHHSVVIIELDPSGGSLAAWLDTPAHPSLASLVANVGSGIGRDATEVLALLSTMTHHSASGVRFIANAVRARSAHRSVEEAALALLPTLADSSTVVIADTGAHRAGHAPSPALRAADVIVIVHRQACASAAAATVRIDRLVELIEELAHLDAILVLAVIGNTPFNPAEIGSFVDQSVPETVFMTVAVADDPLAAATIAGRAGVSAKRLRRLPLPRDAVRLAGDLADLIDVRLFAQANEHLADDPTT